MPAAPADETPVPPVMLMDTRGGSTLVHPLRFSGLVYVRPGERSVHGRPGDPDGTEFRLPFLLFAPF